MKLLIASGNDNKIEEIKAKLSKDFELLGLKDLNITEEIPETAETLEGNALLKAEFLYNLKGINCFADDTGLEVEALHGEPGVYSARYAGSQRNAEDNMDLLLKNLTGKANRKARFRTVVLLIINGQKHVFEGVVEGEITINRSGAKGFREKTLSLRSKFFKINYKLW